MLGGFAVRSTGVPPDAAAGGCAAPRRWSSCWRSRPSGSCTASRSSSCCGPTRRRDAHGLHQVLYTARRALAGERRDAPPTTSWPSPTSTLGDAGSTSTRSSTRPRRRACRTRRVAYRAALELSTGASCCPRTATRTGRRLGASRCASCTSRCSSSWPSSRTARYGGDRDAPAGGRGGPAARGGPPRADAAASPPPAAASRRSRSTSSCARALRAELEADPDPESRRLYREILAGAEPRPRRARHRARRAASGPPARS